MTSLRELQLFELQMLKEITRAFDENGIEYFLACGTLLGAVRHGGFIPWDDDIDLYMTVKNYKKFRKIGQKILGDKYFVQNYLTENHYCEQWTKVVANGTKAVANGLKEWNINLGIGIDVFPILGIRNITKQKKALMLNRTLLCDCFMKATNQSFTKKQKILFAIPRSIRRMICRLNENRFLIDSNSTERCTMLWYKLNKEFPSKLFAQRKLYTFEDGEFYSVDNADEYLSLYFGDYMVLPPKEERIGHDSEFGKIIYEF